jgi:predicted DNA-binding transcriptional regulator YafY
MFNQNRIFRVFELINFLKAKPSKSMKTLVSLLDISERSVYRYLDLLAELGVSVIKDEEGRYYLPAHVDLLALPFTVQEVDYLVTMVQSVGNQHPLSHSVLEKIRHLSVVGVGAENLFKAHLSQIIFNLYEAITQKHQVVLKNYYSANSQIVSDRLVEPIAFTPNYESLVAYEVKAGENKYFKVERISDVKPSKVKFKFEEYHKYHEPDIFGFQGTSMDKTIELDLSMRAYLMLKEEFPLSLPFVEEMYGTGRFYFKAKVQSFLAPARFVKGLENDVNVLGSKPFIRFLKSNKENN